MSGDRPGVRRLGALRPTVTPPRADPPAGGEGQGRAVSDARPYAVVRRTRRRGGGAGRVGPPATRRRLCVLLQIGDKLVASLEQFLLVDDVVAVEDGAALVAGQEHGDPLGDAGADQVAGGGAAAIVEEAGRHAGRLTGGIDANDRLLVTCLDRGDAA